MYDIIIIGGGPAGLTAALYARRAGKTVLVIEKNTFGGQIVWSPKVENFPGFASVSGMELGDKLMTQAMSVGAELELDEVTKVSKNDDGFCVCTQLLGQFEAKALIFATGSAPRHLGLPNEEALIGGGISFCAVCDGEFFRGSDVAVVGGGNTALQEALYLSDICANVHLIHRRDTFRADQSLTERIARRPNIHLHCPSEIIALHGTDQLQGVTILSKGESHQETHLAVNGLFVAVGHDPQTSLLTTFADLDEYGYVYADENTTTRTAGIFVAGDCRKKSVKQLTTAVADGSCAAIAACHYLDSLS